MTPPQDRRRGRKHTTDDASSQVESLRGLLKATECEAVRLREEVAKQRETIRRLRFDRVQASLDSLEHRGNDDTHSSQASPAPDGHFAALYVGLSRLCSSATPAEVLVVIKEIVANLIGSEQMAILDLNAEPFAQFGVDDSLSGTLSECQFQIKETVRRGVVYVSEQMGGSLTPWKSGNREPMVACIPLKLRNRVMGAIAIFALLPHKPELTRRDCELMDMLSQHAAKALFSADLAGSQLSVPSNVGASL